MTKKSDFTADEWKLIKDGPEWVFAALAAADGNVAITLKMKESKAFKSELDGYRSRSELMAEILEDSSKAAKETKRATLSEAEDAIGKINDILDAKVPSGEAAEYRRFMLSIAESVAGATGEGALGLGEKFSKKEKDAMLKIKAALRSATKGAKPSAQKPAAPKKPAPAKSAAKTASKPVRRPTRTSDVGAPPQKFARQEAKPKVIAEHTVEGNQTLTHITLKHYGKTAEKYWRYLYEFNKDVIGDNPSIIVPGMKLQIPELPDELKD